MYVQLQLHLCMYAIKHMIVLDWSYFIGLFRSHDHACINNFICNLSPCMHDFLFIALTTENIQKFFEEVQKDAEEIVSWHDFCMTHLKCQFEVPSITVGQSAVGTLIDSILIHVTHRLYCYI